MASASAQKLASLRNYAPVVAVANGDPALGCVLCEHRLRDKGPLETVVVHGLEVSVSAWQMASSGILGPSDHSLGKVPVSIGFLACWFFMTSFSRPGRRVIHMAL